jgi:hypothetical protein|nr:MAG TPA: hypothetical protein [Caudoviricetes sp.]
MEQRYLNKKSLEELLELVQAKAYYQRQLDELSRLKEKMGRSKKHSIDLIISYEVGPEISDHKMEEFAVKKASNSLVDYFEMIPNRVIEELQTELLNIVSSIESYLWDRFGYTDDEAAMKEAELQEKINRFMFEKSLQIEISPNATRNFFDAGTSIRKMLETTLNQRTDGNDNDGGKQDEQV